MRTLVLAVSIAAALLGCGGDSFESAGQTSSGNVEPKPANVAGAYHVTVTNRQNGCGIMNWMEGGVAQDIPLDITQDGADITGTVGGVIGSLAELWLGSRVFEGKVTGNDIDMTLHGTNS